MLGYIHLHERISNMTVLVAYHKYNGTLRDMDHTAFTDI